jgi:hypothetical protein
MWYVQRSYNQGSWSSKSVRPSEAHLTLNGRNMPFVNHAIYLGVIFYKRFTWRLHIVTIQAKVFRTFITINSLLKSERLSASIKLTLHNALIRSVMTYACPAWELGADTRLLKLERLKTRFTTPLEIFQGAHRSAICTPLSTFRKYAII